MWVKESHEQSPAFHDSEYEFSLRFFRSGVASSIHDPSPGDLMMLGLDLAQPEAP